MDSMTVAALTQARIFLPVYPTPQPGFLRRYRNCAIKIGKCKMPSSSSMSFAYKITGCPTHQVPLTTGARPHRFGHTATAGFLRARRFRWHGVVGGEAKQNIALFERAGSRRRRGTIHRARNGCGCAVADDGSALSKTLAGCPASRPSVASWANI